MVRVHAPFLCLLLLASAVQAAPSGTGEPHDVAARALARRDADVALLRRAVEINSGTFNLEGVRRVADAFRPSLEALGFQVTWVDGSSFGRAGHLLAHRGTRGPRVLLIGHLDTVFEPDSPFQHFELDGNIARGPGTSDMKGGIVVMLSALHVLADLGRLDDLDLRIVLTGDEEEPGEPLASARAALVAEARDADVALGFENADDDPSTAVVARRSSSSWTLSVTAPSAHSSQIFRTDIGAGAIFEATRILEAFRTRLAGEEYLTFNPGLMLAGAQVQLDDTGMGGRAAGKDNIIVPSAYVRGDLRAISVEQRDRAWALMGEIAAAHLPHASARFEYSDDYPPLAPRPGNHALLARYDEASRALGYGPVSAVDPRRAGAADISFVDGLAPMAMDGLGLLGGGNHTTEEFANLELLPRQVARLALLLLQLAPAP